MGPILGLIAGTVYYVSYGATHVEAAILTTLCAIWYELLRIRLNRD